MTAIYNFQAKSGGLRTKRGNKFSILGCPLITVITATYNAAQHLPAIAQSIRDQTYPNFEWIVIDGGSSDKTVEILRQNEDIIDYWVSEPDDGIYDAMNKGIDHAVGDWLYFIGADDVLYKKEILSDIVKLLNQANLKLGLIYGDICYEGGRIFRSKFSVSSLKFKNTLHHQAAIYGKEAFATFRYSKKYRISGDYELNLKMALDGVGALYTGLVFAECGAVGLSSKVLLIGYQEEIAIRRERFGYSFYDIGTLLRYILKKIRNAFY